MICPLSQWVYLCVRACMDTDRETVSSWWGPPVDVVVRTGVFQMKGLMVAALCHDVDHRGLSNAFMEEYRQPLHVVYKSSIMEQHHFATVVKIIQVTSSSTTLPSSTKMWLLIRSFCNWKIQLMQLFYAVKLLEGDWVYYKCERLRLKLVFRYIEQ